MLVRNSSIMNHKGFFENKLIRIPKVLREKLKVDLGEFIHLEGDVILQVDMPYKQDLEKHGQEVAFVTESTMLLFNETTVKELNATIVNTITLGCDPELFLINGTTGKLVDPSYTFRKLESLGYDGLLCELRPNPSIDQAVVRDNIFRLIQQAHDTFERRGKNYIHMIGASAMCDLTAGFHCHMGIPQQLLDKRAQNYKKILDTVVRVLDYYVGILAVIPEGSYQNARRCSPYISYGKVSDYRVSSRTLEYRVPGGVMLVTPTLTEGLLGLCSLVTNNALYKLKEYTDNYTKKDLPNTEEILKAIYPQIPDLVSLYKIMCAPDTNLAEKESTSIFEDFKKMYNYSDYADLISRFKVDLFAKHESNDIWYNWTTSRRSNNVQQSMVVF